MTRENNGGISAVSWNTYGSANQGGYRFAYDLKSRLTSALYLTDGSRSTHYDTSYSYDSMGNLTSLTRNGRLDNGTFGKVNQLTYGYDGNRLVSVSDAVIAPSYNGFFGFINGADKAVEYEYDANGNMTRDWNKGISSITYNVGNLPLGIQYGNGNRAIYRYAADGTKLQVNYVTSYAGLLSNSSQGGSVSTAIAKTHIIDYVGNRIYEDGRLNKILVDGGYVDYNGGKPVYIAYLTDHQGNIRMVVSESAAVRQVVNYYPYGALMAAGPRVYVHRYMYNGKELDRMHGLDWYDYGARHYDAAIGRWHSMDDMCYAYYDISPYAYCCGDPVNAIDPDGRSTWVTDRGDGQYKVFGGDINDNDRRVYLYSNDKNGNPNVRGKAIGITATMYSFYDSDYNNGEGKWMTNSIIDSNDMSGDNFLHNFVHDSPPLFNDYMKNAQNGGCYDFKSTNGGQEKIEGIDYYRGMPIGETGDGLPIFASARDVGNIAAGYIAAANGMSWKQARKGFDGYQSKVSGRPTVEGLTTRSAEAYGYRIGYSNTSPLQQGVNLRHSINEGIRTIWKNLKSIFNGF